MNALFVILWGAILILPQILFHFPFTGRTVAPGFVTLLVIQAAFTQSFLAGLVGVVVATFLFEIFSSAPHGTIILSHVILFVAIQTVVARIYTESYLTKALWVALFSVLAQLLINHVVRPAGSGLDYWEVTASAVGNGLVSIPLLIIMDGSYELWSRVVSPKQASLTGADFYQVRSKQRKFF